MKELSLEEKARAYDEALKLARDYHEDKNCFKYLKGVLKNIFPELVDSEDERIKKALINFFNDGYCHDAEISDNCEVTVHDALIWLEKQGREKPKWTLRDEELYQDTLDAFEALANNLNPLEDWGKLYDWLKSLKRRVMPEYVKESQISQHENQTCKENDDFLTSEDERIKKDIISHLQHEYIVKKNVSDVEYDKWIAWLEKQGESDETKAKIFLINNGYPIDTNGTFPTYAEIYNIIREGLENQGEKPKWTEEDECYMGECISAISTKDSWSFEEKRRTKHWLNSIKERME